MSLSFLFALTLIGPLSPLSADDWRHEYQQTMLATIERAKLPAAVAVPQLIELYVSLEKAEALPRVERSRMRRSLEGRLVKQLEHLVRNERKRDSIRLRGVDQQRAGGAAVGAQQLIELIVNTIAPDSWRQNGGEGSISFYPYNPALVIRQTSETHEQVGELLRALTH
ncbi:MAG TPA: hypothetical protein VGM98_03385 [Schlesneria sp.]